MNICREHKHKYIFFGVLLRHYDINKCVRNRNCLVTQTCNNFRHIRGDPDQSQRATRAQQETGRDRARAQRGDPATVPQRAGVPHLGVQPEQPRLHPRPLPGAGGGNISRHQLTLVPSFACGFVFTSVTSPAEYCMI